MVPRALCDRLRNRSRFALGVLGSSLLVAILTVASAPGPLTLAAHSPVSAVEARLDSPETR